MRVIAVDLGYGGAKVYEPGKETMIASFIGDVLEHSEPSAETCIVGFDGIKLMVGRDVFMAGSEKPSMSPERWLGGNEARAAFYAGMGAHLKGVKAKEPISLYVGLPADITSVDRRADTQRRVSGWLCGDHSWDFNGKKVSIQVGSVTVRSQASGAIFDLIHTTSGEFSRDVEYLDRGVGVLSIGFNTIELSGGMYGKSAANMMMSAPLGVQALLQQCATNKRAGLSMLDSALRSRRFGGDFEAKRKKWAGNIVSAMETKWQTVMGSIERIMVVGGGAQHAELELREKFGNLLYIPPSPIFSVARGLYKMGVVDAKASA